MLQAELRPLAAVEAAHLLAGVQRQLPVAVEVVHPLQPRLLEVVHQLQAQLRQAEEQRQLRVADVGALRQAAVVHLLLAALDRVLEELVVAATRTETLMTGEAISKWVGLPSAVATAEEFGTGKNGTFGADDGTSTGSAGAGSRPRSVSFGFAAEVRLRL